MKRTRCPLCNAYLCFARPSGRASSVLFLHSAALRSGHLRLAPCARGPAGRRFLCFDPASAGSSSVLFPPLRAGAPAGGRSPLRSVRWRTGSALPRSHGAGSARRAASARARAAGAQARRAWNSTEDVPAAAGTQTGAPRSRSDRKADRPPAGARNAAQRSGGIAPRTRARRRPRKADYAACSIRFRPACLAA